MPFHPTGNSQKITVSNGVPQSIEMTGLPNANKVVRLLFLTHPTKTVVFVNMGDEGVMVSTATGMPLESGMLKEQYLSVGDETHITVLMQGNANYEIMVTPGEIV